MPRHFAAQCRFGSLIIDKSVKYIGAGKDSQPPRIGIGCCSRVGRSIEVRPDRVNPGKRFHPHADGGRKRLVGLPRCAVRIALAPRDVGALAADALGFAAGDLASGKTPLHRCDLPYPQIGELTEQRLLPPRDQSAD